MSIISTLVLLGSLAASANAHGRVQGIVAGGTYYEGYSPLFQYDSTEPTVIGWSDPSDLTNGYISDYTSSDINCHLSATPAQAHAPIAAGDTVTFEWTVWPDDHHGAVITYLAKCSGSCEDADKDQLEWFKIDAAGLINDDTIPGTWASDQLIANNNSYTVTIPSTIAAGNYVARHEIIALHLAETSGGAQNYPQCINLQVTSDGTDEPEGTLGTSLYTASDPGLLINIFVALSTYEMPGPTLYTGGSSASATSSAYSSASSTAAATSSTSSAWSSAAWSAAYTSYDDAAATPSSTSSWSSEWSSAAPTPYSSSTTSVWTSAAPTYSSVPSSSSVTTDEVIVTETDIVVVTATTLVTVTASAYTTDGTTYATPAADFKGHRHHARALHV